LDQQNQPREDAFIVAQSTIFETPHIVLLRANEIIQ